MSVTNLPISGWNVDCLSKILHGIGRVIGHDKINYEFISYTMNSFLVKLNQEEDDQSGDLESADADADNNVDVEMNTSVDDADRDNFELQYNSSLDQYRKERFLFNTGSLQNTAEEVEESSMDTAILVGNRRWLQERNLQIADTTAAETEVYHMMTNGTILDIGCGSNLRNFTEEIRDQMERESRMGKLYIQLHCKTISMICKQQHPSMIKFVKLNLKFKLLKQCGHVLFFMRLGSCGMRQETGLKEEEVGFAWVGLLIRQVPQFNDLFLENQLYHKVSTYLTSLPAIEDSDLTNLFSGSKANDIILHLDKNQVIHDSFLGARVHWSNEKYCEGNGKRTLVLKLRKKDKRMILRPYLQHILSVADQVEQKSKEIKLFMNLEKNPYENGRWRSVPFTHPATMDTMIMDGDLKNKVKADLELFLKSKHYYHRLGHVWKRSYLLYGASGTGKSSFIAAMARFLNFDVYDINISKVSGDSDLKMLLLQTTSRSMIVIEDFDRFLTEKSRDVSLSGVLNFMDGIVSCCGEERVMVFTMNCKDQIDQAVLRPGRVDVHIQFPLCNFSAFKSLANNYLGVKEHKLFSQVEEILQYGGSSLSPTEIGEIMISNRNSPTRALKSVISALQSQTNSGDLRGPSKVGQRMTGSRSARSSRDETGETGGVFSQESSVHAVREFKTLYGLWRMGSRRKESMDLSSSAEKEESQQAA
ncbi:hypothetical protein POTOM_042658 [Populus tomentosa]|uniref:AAA+ ATPase domain-containing protein n=1 Tax=Populus tomentosa TaxID=118781 RepID=A0A8X7YKR5_POPTO|nr:hypothetical protein POTOM_042658 [Populus tomentosa]